MSKENVINLCSQDIPDSAQLAQILSQAESGDSVFYIVRADQVWAFENEALFRLPNNIALFDESAYRQACAGFLQHEVVGQRAESLDLLALHWSLVPSQIPRFRELLAHKDKTRFLAVDLSGVFSVAAEFAREFLVAQAQGIFFIAPDIRRLPADFAAITFYPDRTTLMQALSPATQTAGKPATVLVSQVAVAHGTPTIRLRLLGYLDSAATADRLFASLAPYQGPKGAHVIVDVADLGLPVDDDARAATLCAHFAVGLRQLLPNQRDTVVQFHSYSGIAQAAHCQGFQLAADETESLRTLCASDRPVIVKRLHPQFSEIRLEGRILHHADGQVAKHVLLEDGKTLVDLQQHLSATVMQSEKKLIIIHFELLPREYVLRLALELSNHPEAPQVAFVGPASLLKILQTAAPGAVYAPSVEALLDSQLFRIVLVVSDRKATRETVKNMAGSITAAFPSSCKVAVQLVSRPDIEQAMSFVKFGFTHETEHPWDVAVVDAGAGDAALNARLEAMRREFLPVLQIVDFDAGSQILQLTPMQCLREEIAVILANHLTQMGRNDVRLALSVRPQRLLFRSPVNQPAAFSQALLIAAPTVEPAFASLLPRLAERTPGIWQISVFPAGELLMSSMQSSPVGGPGPFFHITADGNCHWQGGPRTTLAELYRIMTMITTVGGLPHALFAAEVGTTAEAGKAEIFWSPSLLKAHFASLNGESGWLIGKSIAPTTINDFFRQAMLWVKPQVRPVLQALRPTVAAAEMVELVVNHSELAIHARPVDASALGQVAFACKGARFELTNPDPAQNSAAMRIVF